MPLAFDSVLSRLGWLGHFVLNALLTYQKAKTLELCEATDRFAKAFQWIVMSSLMLCGVLGK